MRGNTTASAAPHPPLRGTLSPQAGRGQRDRLLLCWDLLIEQAATGRTITYSDFAPKLGVAPLGIGRWLTPPLHWCRRHGLSDLPIIVVSKGTGRPRGDYLAETIAAETARVFAFDWAAVERPDDLPLSPLAAGRDRGWGAVVTSGLEDVSAPSSPRAPDRTSRRDPRTPRARQLRHDATPMEKRLWRALKQLESRSGHFRRQVPIGPYFADFAHHVARLVIEVDGATHSTDDEVRRDAARTADLERRGYRVLRFWNEEVRTNLDGVIATILNATSAATPPTPSPSPPQAGGGERG